MQRKRNGKLAEAIGAKVRVLRLSREWSQKELADRLAVRQPDVSDLERGHHVPETETLVRLANTFGVSITDLLAVA